MPSLIKSIRRGKFEMDNQLQGTLRVEVTFMLRVENKFVLLR